MKQFAALCLLAGPLILAGCGHDYDDQRGAYGAPPPAAQFDPGRMGHQDGIRAGSDDLRDGRRPDPRRHGEFRHPPVDGRYRDEYRRGYEDGYNDAFRNGQPYDAPPARDYDRR